MSVLLVIVMLLLFLAADFLVQRSRARRETAAAIPVPAELQLLVNHTWTRREPGGDVVIGLDEFLAGALGAVERFVLPEPGGNVAPETADIVLAAGNRRLALQSPLAGRVVEVNSAVLENPALASEDPFGRGWLLKIRADLKRSGEYAAHVVRDPADWLQSQRENMREFFLMSVAQPVPLTLQDGGEPVDGILRECDAGVWDAFGRTFATLRPVAGTVGEHAR